MVRDLVTVEVSRVANAARRIDVVGVMRFVARAQNTAQDEPCAGQRRQDPLRTARTA